MRRPRLPTRAPAVQAAAGLTALALLAGCSSDPPRNQADPTSTPTTSSSPTPSKLPPTYPAIWNNHPGITADGLRDARIWPYPSNSIWNTPLGDQARLVPLGLQPPAENTLSVEEDILVVTPDARPRPIFYSPAGWNKDLDRCGDRSDQVLVGGVPVAAGFHTDPGYFGLTPNHPTAIVRRNGTLIETQPFDACSDGHLVSLVAPSDWQGGSILSGDTPYHVHQGAHGASGLTAFGGTIRMGEWVPGGVIPHALKIELWAAKYLSDVGGGFRWPATKADRYHSEAYGGSNPAARMGSLLALPPDFDVDTQLHSHAAQILAQALQDYGAYVVGDTKRDAVAFSTEWGPAGRVLQQFSQDWGFPLYGNAASASGDQRTFLHDLEVVYQHLEVVDDNAPDQVGGAGLRRQPLPPPLAPWTS